MKFTKLKFTERTRGGNPVDTVFLEIKGIPIRVHVYVFKDDLWDKYPEMKNQDLAMNDGDKGVQYGIGQKYIFYNAYIRQKTVKDPNLPKRIEKKVKGFFKSPNYKNIVPEMKKYFKGLRKLSKNKIYFKGKPYKLQISGSLSSEGKVSIQGKNIIVHGLSVDAKKHLTNWMKKEAMKSYKKWADYYTQVLEKNLIVYYKEETEENMFLQRKEAAPADVVETDSIIKYIKAIKALILGYKKRVKHKAKIELFDERSVMGSLFHGYSSNEHYIDKGYQLINFNWRFIMAPPYVLKGLVAHEVCHIAVYGHDQDFFDVLQKVDPNWKKAEDWKKLNSNIELIRSILPDDNTNNIW